MNFLGSNVNQNYCGCNNECPNIAPTYQQCNQVVQTCNVENVPHYINYHTHGNSKWGYIKSKMNG